MIKLAYADDVVTLGWGISTLQEEMERQKNWNEDNDMRLNKNKSGVMFLEEKNNNKIDKKYKKLNLQGFPLK